MDLHHRSLNLIGTSSFDSNTEKSRHASIEKEHMFDKVVTPSDVGKLNRLVIPKQYAEKYFPFDSFTNEKEGLLLNFEDREGKPWRFRYSYWNSSQSYVMTKGWSGFVKDKKLDAGDVVSFQRGATETSRDRLFIDWQHRPTAASSSLGGGLHEGRMLSREQYYRSFGAPQLLYRHVGLQQLGYSVNNRYMMGGTGRGDPNAVYFRPRTGSVGTTAVRSPVVFRSVPPLVQAAKRLRLFGVNMDCPIVTDQSDHDHNHRQIDLSSALVAKPSIIGELSQKLPRLQYDDPRPVLSNSWQSSTMSLDINFQNLR